MQVTTETTSQSNLVFGNIQSLEMIANNWIKRFNPADVFWLREKEGTNSIQVAQVLKLVEQANLSAVGSHKLFIIINASNLTIAAQNKLLKTIEETRPDTVFLLLATNQEKILPTIKSRCVKSNAPLYEVELNPDILEAATKLLLECKTLDDALPLIPLLAAKENFEASMIALNKVVGKNLNTLQFNRSYGILKTLSIINRNVAANCNSNNAFDLLLMELFT